MGIKPATVWLDGKKPTIGDIAPSKAVGRVGRALHIWEACPTCGKERWIKLNTKGSLCVSCAQAKHSFGESNVRWTGGKRYADNGIFLTITSEHPFYTMTIKVGKTRQIAEHRLVVAQSIGRCLRSWEIVHHINRNNYDNRLENLQLLPNQTVHQSYTLLQMQVSKLESQVGTLSARVTILEAENALLRSQNSDAGHGNPEPSREAFNPSRACVETIDHPSGSNEALDEEIVQPCRKL